MRLAAIVCALVSVFSVSGASAERPAFPIGALLETMDRAGVHDEAPNVAALPEPERAALGRELLVHVREARGRQAGAGPSIAYMTAAAQLPNRVEIALAFLARPRRQPLTGEMPAAFHRAFEALGAHEPGLLASPEACALLTSWIETPPPALFRARARVSMESLALVVSRCPSPPLAAIVRVCSSTIGTECDTARVRAGDPVRTNELVEGGLALPSTDPVAAGMNLWGMLVSAFVRAGDRAPVERLLPLLDDPAVLHVAVMFHDGPSASSTTYADIGVADLFVALAVSAWRLPVHFAPTPAGALAERVYTTSEREEVRRLVRARVAR